MGFYITIRMTLMMCDVTGKPYFYGKNSENISEKIYGYPVLDVPEKYRRFLNEKNSIYRAYMVNEDQYQNFTDELLDRFPTWEDVKEDYPDAEDEYNWTEVDHNLLKDALEWFSHTDISFMVSWG